MTLTARVRGDCIESFTYHERRPNYYRNAGGSYFEIKTMELQS